MPALRGGAFRLEAGRLRISLVLPWRCLDPDDDDSAAREFGIDSLVSPIFQLVRPSAPVAGSSASPPSLLLSPLLPRGPMVC